MTDVYFVYVTVPEIELAKTIARCVVEEGFAACANVIPHVTSYYIWQGSLEEANEVIIVLKTTHHMFEKLEARIRGLHPNKCPCIVAANLAEGAADFVNWIHDSVRPA
ncbi:MAG: divalent-cation tolerance protein CutA [Alphaproteobacteria bacterium]|nr:divalent-cation tolerance protein CutA [Alphaproteobacteria bacterium]